MQCHYKEEYDKISKSRTMQNENKRVSTEISLLVEATFSGRVLSARRDISRKGSLSWRAGLRGKSRVQ